MKRFLTLTLHLARDAFQTTFTLFKIIFPISLAVRILTLLGLTGYLGAVLGPVMQLVGLPGSMGLVWATAMLTNIYGGMFVFAALAPAEHLTVAQVTVLGTMMLVAHGLPVEVGITQIAGLRPWAMALLRLVSALVLGWLLNQIYTAGHWLQTANYALWNPPLRDASWLGWAQAEAQNWLSIYLIILGSLVMMKVLAWLGIIDLLKKALGPVVGVLGMSQAAIPTTIIGMLLGLSYGGGLIIQEARSGLLSKHDVFFSLALLSVCHSIVEDTFLMVVLGSHLSGILWARLVFSLVVMFLLVKVVDKMPAAAFNRWLIRSPSLL